MLEIDTSTNVVIVIDTSNDISNDVIVSLLSFFLWLLLFPSSSERNTTTVHTARTFCILAAMSRGTYITLVQVHIIH